MQRRAGRTVSLVAHAVQESGCRRSRGCRGEGRSSSGAEQVARFSPLSIRAESRRGTPPVYCWRRPTAPVHRRARRVLGTIPLATATSDPTADRGADPPRSGRQRGRDRRRDRLHHFGAGWISDRPDHLYRRWHHGGLTVTSALPHAESSLSPDPSVDIQQLWLAPRR